MDPIALHRRGCTVSRELVQGIGDGQWSAPTPNRDWDVRALVVHLTEEHLWVPPLMAGRRIAEIGSVGDDVPGADPVGSHEAAAAAAQAAIEEPGVLRRTVHLSFGDTDGAFYALQRTADLLIHGWDLAVATGQPLELDDELVRAAWEVTVPHLTPELRAAGVFGPAVDVPDDADTFTRLLGLTGRDPDWGRGRTAAAMTSPSP